MLCSITKGWFVALFLSDHWHRYVLNFFVILYLSFVIFDLWFSMLYMKNLLGYLGLVVGVVVLVAGVRGCPRFWVVILYYLICIFLGVCGLVGVYYIGLDNFGYNFVGKKIVLLCVVRFLLVLSGFYSRFESLLVTLSVCH